MCKLAGDMGQSIIPGRLDQLIDEVNPGTVIKHLTEPQRVAIIVDFVGSEPRAIAVEVEKNVRDGKKLPSKPKHYRVFLVDEYENWLVLKLGNDILFVQ